MQPRPDSDIVKIPITFDGGSKGRIAKDGKALWVFLIALIWIVSSILVIIGGEIFWKIAYPIISFIVLLSILRFIVMREKYFKVKRKELIENNYTFNHSVFWDIYEISDKYPYFVQFGNGKKGLFVVFDKDVTVGKQDNAEYLHYEAISNAYQQMAKRHIECMHIDYMDTVGKDNRMDSLFRSTESVKNDDLRKVLLRMYDNVEFNMKRVYSSYDVYCFYSNDKNEIFWDNLQIILMYFGKANYIRHRLLNKEEISLLVKSLMNIDDFSINAACESLFKDIHNTDYLRPIWTEVDGKRTILNKTLDEIAEVKRVTQAEKKLKKSHKKRKSIFGKKKDDNPDIDLFE